MSSYPTCHGDHFWDGSSQCSSCGARLRCACGCYVREDNLEKHFKTCRYAAAEEQAAQDELNDFLLGEAMV